MENNFFNINNSAAEKEITFTASDIGSFLDKILNWGLPVLVFTIPLVFIPVTADQFDLPKQLLALIGTLFLFTVATLKRSLDNKFGFLRTPLNLPIILLPIVGIVSAILNPTQYSSLIATALSLAPLALVFFVTTSSTDSIEKSKKILMGATLSATLLGIWTILCFVLFMLNKIPGMTEVFSRLPATLATMLSLNFSLSGSIYAQAAFAAGLLPVLFFNRGQKWNTLAMSIIGVSLVINLFTMYVSRPIFLPLFASWKVATGVLGNSATNALFGTGVDNFLNAFVAYRPLDMNVGNLWSLRYNASGDFYMQILSTLGVFGLAIVAWIVVSFFKIMKLRLSLGVAKEWEKGLLFSIAAILAGLVILPAPFSLQFLVFVMLGLLFVNYKHHEVVALASEKVSSIGSFVTFLSATIPAILFLAATYFGVRHLIWADYSYAASLRAAAENKGTDTYNLQVAATTLNPYKDQYHLSYSQTNLALADALAGQAQKDGTALTEAQRNTIIQLVQQAIREARLAAAANPGNPANWENLTTVYRSLINFAQGADQWAVASQNQAITLDPTNPRLRLDLGGLYYSVGNYNAAAQLFNAAAQLKSDYANAHYNLAQAYKMLKANDMAAQELSTAKNLVCSAGTTDDCNRIDAELTALNKPVEEKTATPSAKTVITNQPETKVATASATPSNLNKIKTTTTISTGSGEVKP